MNYRIFVTDGAADDVRGIQNWLFERSPAGAKAWFRRWQEVLDTLSRRADTLGEAPESMDHPERIHQVLFQTRRGRRYRALFLIRDDWVFILHVRAPGQPLLSRSELRSPPS